jgi:hypothetical protein
MRRLSSLVLVAVALIAVSVAPVHAHFKLLAPASWLTEDNSGGPQKGGPCGPGGGDDVQPVPMSMKVTTVHAGDMVDVQIQETIHHPGWFRIALAEDPSMFKDPDFPNANCTVDMSKVPTTAHDNVLMDGLAMDSSLTGSNRMLTEKVQIPNKPCEKCTLQVIQVMADAVHSPPGCVYHHCAELKILPAADGSGAAGSTATAGSPASAGSSASAGNTGASGSAAGSMAAAAGASGKTVAAAGSGGAAGSVATTAAGSTATKPTSSVAGSPSTTGTTGTTTSGVSSGAAGAVTMQPVTAPTSAKSGGCTVARIGSSRHGHPLAIGGLASMVFVLGLRARIGKKRRARLSRS